MLFSIIIYFIMIITIIVITIIIIIIVVIIIVISITVMLQTSKAMFWLACSNDQPSRTLDAKGGSHAALYLSVSVLPER